MFYGISKFVVLYICLVSKIKIRCSLDDYRLSPERPGFDSRQRKNSLQSLFVPFNCIAHPGHLFSSPPGMAALVERLPLGCWIKMMWWVDQII
jgi:hypothetical protein